MKAASVFSDNMVLQREKPVRIFGTCDPDCAPIRVTVPECGASACAVIKNGRWEALLPPMKAMKECSIEIVSGGEKIIFRNAAIGEVWLAGGQSNMEFELHSDKNGISELSKCAGEDVRFYYTNKCEMVDDKLLAAEANSGWNLPSEKGAWAWSAVGYYFAKELSRKLGVTVGILGCNWGGTSASAWLPREYLERDTRLTPYLEDYDRAVAGKTDDEMIKEYDDYLVYHANWEQNMQKLYAERPDVTWGEVLRICGENRYPGPMGIKNPMRPCGLYDTMVSRVCPYTLKGVIWYQGESDDHRPGSYYTLMSTLIECWREKWHDDEMPFIMVQLPMFRYAEDPDYKHWCLIREAQEKVFRTVRNTGLAVALDCGEFNNIHPVNKAPVGHRLYLQAAWSVYNIIDKDEANAPFYCWHETDGDILTVHTDAESLTAKESFKDCFELAGQDNVYFPADSGEVSGGAIVLKSKKVPHPVSVRYLWTNFADVRIFGENGLPLAPFRTSREENIPENISGTAIRSTDGGQTGL